MFEPETQPIEEPKHNHFVIGALAVICLGLVAAVLLIANSKPEIKPALPNAVRAGQPDFDNYKSKLTLDVVDKIVHPNMMGMAQYEIQVRVTNRGDRALTGFELAGRMIDLDDKLIKESTSAPIPRARTAPLQPGESFLAAVKIDAPKSITEDMIKDLLVELRALQF
jgi:hypothetical protein